MKALGPVLGIAMMLACSTPASGQTPPEGLVWYVLQELNALDLDLDDPTNRPPLLTKVTDGVITAVDINRDGRTDWLIIWPEQTQFCGTGGCRHTLYVSSPAGFQRALDRQTLDLNIRQVDDEIRLEAWVHHSECADERPDCRYAWTWDERIGRLVERPASDGRTILDGASAGLIDRSSQDGDSDLSDGLPFPLAKAWHAGRRTCLADWTETGVLTTWPEVRDIPDLNGDGRRDWLFTPNLSCDGSASGFQVWISNAREPGPGEEVDAVFLAWQSEPGEGAAIDIGPKPTVLLVTEPCDTGRNCPARALRWDDAASRMVE